MIAGLALYLFYNRRLRTPLYCTDGYAVDMQEVMKIIEMTGENSLNVLGGDFLQVRYLKELTYLTINGDGGTRDPDRKSVV